MDFKTFNRSIKYSSFILILVFLFSCRKEEQETVINFRCETPHNGQGIAGCKLRIREVKERNSASLSSDFKEIKVYEAVTDANGNGQLRFYYKKNSKYQYIPEKDFSGLEIPAGLNNPEVVTKGGFANFLDKNEFEYNYRFNLLGSCEFHRKFENINCFDGNDRLRFSLHNISEYFGSFNSYDATEYLGCGVVHESSSVQSGVIQKTGVWVYKFEITKNGIVEIKYDTTYMQPNIVNEILFEY